MLAVAIPLVILLIAVILLSFKLIPVRLHWEIPGRVDGE